ncbi:DedA family protein [Natrialbaceae archaeon A-arb3/5]
MSVLAPVIEYATLAVRIAGLPALFVIFVLKGALIGKVVPTSVVLWGYVAIAVPTYLDAAALVVLITVAHLLGQLVVYAGSRRYGEAVLTTLPYVEIDPSSERFQRIDRWFNRYGGFAVFLTNVIPWSRGLIAVPAGTSSYPSGRYLVHVSTSTLLYHAVYVAIPLVGLAVLA